MRRRIKRTTKQYIIVAFISITVMGGAATSTAFMITEQIKDKYIALLSDMQQDLDDNQRTIYVAVNSIIRGDYITADNVSKQTVYSGQPVETFITEEDIGKVSIIDIIPGTQILKGMLSENVISSDLRELEYTVLNINSNIANNDTVDVRINYPNGESYVVLTKKVIKGYTIATPNCLLWLDEEEIIRMHSAIVDAFLYTGACLYTTKYIEPNIQEPTIVTYVPSVEALSLIKANPNILDTATNKLSIVVRKALENRLAESLSKDVQQLWDIKSNYIYPEKTAPAAAQNDTPTTSQETTNLNGINNFNEITPTPESIQGTPANTDENTNSKGADLGINQIEENQPELGVEYFMIGG